ncbi:hypothetical protein [Aurantibacter sp.]|uniref:hypothetical protein n=1 Tax=Aurantibacter sp. TaxID=2807103 RepID=UPI0035C7B331
MDNNFNEFEKTEKPAFKFNGLELILCSFIIISAVLKIMHIPGSSLLLILSLSLGSMMYLYLSFAILNGIPLFKIHKKESYLGVSVKQMIFVILIGILFSSSLIGVLFKIMHWPGATVLTLLPLVGLVISLILSLYLISKKSSSFLKYLIIRIIIILSIGLILFFR